MNNAVYGKTMKNLRNRINVKHLRNKEDYLKEISKASFMSQKYLKITCQQFVKTKLH